MSERRLYLHTGLGKTGTTSIQMTFFAARDELRGKGIVYPDITSNHHQLVYAHSTPPPTFHNKHLRDGVRTPEAWNDQGRQAERRLDAALGGEWSDIVVSAESFGYLEASELASLRAFLERRAALAKVIVYVRDPLRWTASDLQQGLRSGQSLEFLLERARPPAYRQIIAAHRKAFGEMLDVRLFEQAIAGDGGLLGDFSAAIGRPGLEREIKEQRRNSSSGPIEVMILDRINRKYPVLVNGALNPERAMDLPALLSIRESESVDLSPLVMQAIGSRIMQAYAELHEALPAAREYCPGPKVGRPPDLSSLRALERALDQACAAINEMALFAQKQQADALAFKSALRLEQGTEALRQAEEMARKAIRRDAGNDTAQQVLKVLK